MSFLDGIRHRITVLTRGADYARDAEREMQFHLELARLATSGTRDTLDAEIAARRELGNMTYYREEVRRMTASAWLDSVRQNALYGIRGLKRAPGFASAVVATLALGIGVNSAMFSLLDHVFLSPPAGVTEPQSVRRMYLDFVNGRGSEGRLVWPSIEYPQFRAFRAAVDSGFAIGIYSQPDSSVVRDGDRRISVRYSRVNPDYFVVAGTRAQAGRLFTKDESEISTPTPVAVLSDAFWRREFGGERGILGHHFFFGKQQFTVVGIAPPAFTGLDVDAVEMWVPANTYEGSGGGMPGPWYNSFGASFKVIMRPESASADQRLMTVATNSIRPVNMRGFVYDPTIRATSGPIIEALGPESTTNDIKVATRIAGVALMVLIIAAANVTNLLLLRASRRRREIAVRRALGVSRLRLVEQLTIESLILAILGGVAALAFSTWATVAIRRLVLPRVHWASGPIDFRTVTFTFGITLVLGMIAGLVPALQAMRPDLVESLKAGMRDGAYPGSRIRESLLALQAALCVVLLVGAGLFIRSHENVQSIGVGYDTRDQLFFNPSFDDPASHVDELRTALPLAAERLRLNRDVIAVAYSSVAPLRGASFRTIYLPGHDTLPQLPGDYGPSMAAVSPEFFKASGLALRMGRDFNLGDQAGTQPVIIVGESMARLYWPGESAIGKCFMILKKDGPCYTVVGVAADAHRRSIIEPAISQFYVPMAQWKDAPRVLIVRTKPGRGAAITRDAEQIVRPLVTGMVGFNARTFASVLEPELRPWRLGMILFSALGILATVIAAIGVYSVVAFGVSERIHEMGIRMALGASHRDILNLVLADGVRIVVVGIAIGVLITLALGRVVASLLFGVLPNDASTLIGGASILCSVGMVACVIPALRAARVDPAKALRAD